MLFLIRGMTHAESPCGVAVATPRRSCITHGITADMVMELTITTYESDIRPQKVAIMMIRYLWNQFWTFIISYMLFDCCKNQRWSPRGRPWPREHPRGHIFKSLASKPQVLKNRPVLGSRTALFFEPLKFCWKTPEMSWRICEDLFHLKKKF